MVSPFQISVPLRLWQIRRRAFADQSGSVMMTAALLLPVVIACVGLSVDYISASTARQQLQAAADAAALAGAKELSLSEINLASIDGVAKTVLDDLVKGESVAGAHVSTEVDDDPISVKVMAHKDLDTLFGRLMGEPTVRVAVHSVARVLGKPNICILGLDSSASGTIRLDNLASVVGHNCSVFSNSKSSGGLQANGNSSMSASFVCSAGGVAGKKDAFQPLPMEDCPSFDDPLSDRPEPEAAACIATDLVVDQSTTLAPGTYCGGLEISGRHDVALEPGVYVIKDGPLKVDKGANLHGAAVGFYLTGSGAELQFDSDSTISLEASEDGVMAGLLFFESRLQSTSATHQLMSDDARVMVGTIYLPQGRLLIGGSSQVGGESAYTAIVARTLEVEDGPTVVLNTDYDLTNVPVPEGIRGTGEPVKLTE